MHYLLIYELAPDYLEKRGALRNDHLKLAWDSHKNGELVLGGALSDPLDTAILFFKGDSEKVAEDFAKKDPYVLNGLIKSWKVRQWHTVAGEMSDKPILPE